MDNKLGVVQIIDSLNTGGAEVLAVNIANSLDEKGINSHICTTRKEGKLLENINKKIGYLFLERKKIIDLKAVFLFKKYLKENNISILHAHATSFFFAFCIKIITPKIKLIYHIHEGKIIKSRRFKLILIKIVSIFCNSIITINKEVHKWATKKMLCKNIFFLNNFPVFYNDKKITSLKGKKGKRFVHLAGFREAKDHETLINAFSLFVKKNIEWSLHLVGPINNDIYAKKILSLIKKKELQNHIFVYGSCLDIANILNQSEIGVLSSKTEGLPISLLEYGLAKLPVIVTNVGDCGKVVSNNETGFVVAPMNIVDLNNKMDILANSDCLKKEFSKKHHLNILNNYSKDSFIKNIINIYQI